jgi:hypothetical protein
VRLGFFLLIALAEGLHIIRADNRTGNAREKLQAAISKMARTGDMNTSVMRQTNEAPAIVSIMRIENDLAEWAGGVSSFPLFQKSG